MKILIIGLTALVGTFVSLSAIERLAGEKSSEELPAEPMGGILGNDQKSGKAEARDQIAPQEKVAYLGVGGNASSEALLMHLELESGLLLATVDPTSPAGFSGLQKNDIIVSVDGTKLTDQDSLRAALAGKKPGGEATLKLIRRGKSIEQKVTLGEAPAIRKIQLQALVPNPAAEMNRLLNQQLGNALGGLGNDELQKELMERLEKALGAQGKGFRQLRLGLGGDMLNGEDLKMGIQGIGKMSLQDEDGSIEMSMKNGQRELKIRDKQGNLLFEGPYDTDTDKAAVPEEYRERVEKLDMGNGSSFQFELNGKDLFQRNKKKGE
ncbi:MAG: PDZ domain-containing protein [Akkermansiaceae bacterium]|nr:PDZ domain-containing protein [Akkermansiaceae bacterium]